MCKRKNFDKEKNQTKPQRMKAKNRADDKEVNLVSSERRQRISARDRAYS